MPSQTTEKDSLDLAKSILLEPFGLDEPALIRAMGTIFNHQVDYADLYFQFTKNESWSLEEGIVKTGSFSIDQGVGVRAVAGDKTCLLYTSTCLCRPFFSRFSLLFNLSGQTVDQTTQTFFILCETFGFFFLVA